MRKEMNSSRLLLLLLLTSTSKALIFKTPESSCFSNGDCAAIPGHGSGFCFTRSSILCLLSFHSWWYGGSCSYNECAECHFNRDCRYGEYCSSSKKCVRQLRSGNGYGVGGGGRPSVAFGDGQVSLSLGDGLDLLNLDLDVGKGGLAGGLLGRQAVEQGGGLGLNPVGRRAVDPADGHLLSRAVPGGRARSLDYEATLRNNEEAGRKNLHKSISRPLQFVTPPTTTTTTLQETTRGVSAKVALGESAIISKNQAKLAELKKQNKELERRMKLMAHQYGKLIDRLSSHSNDL